MRSAKHGSRCMLSLLLLLLVMGTTINALGETIAVIGTGEMGSALGQRFTQLGHRVAYGSRNPS